MVGQQVLRTSRFNDSLTTASRSDISSGRHVGVAIIRKACVLKLLNRISRHFVKKSKGDFLCLFGICGFLFILKNIPPASSLSWMSASHILHYIYFSIRDESLENDDKYRIPDDFNLPDVQGDLSAIAASQEYSQFSELLFWHGYSQLVDGPTHYHGKTIDSKFSNLHVKLQSFDLEEFWFHRTCTNLSGEILPILSCENTLYSHHGCLSMKKTKNENLINKCFKPMYTSLFKSG